MSAEVHDRGLQLAQLAQQIQRLGRPTGHEVEPISVPAALQLDVDRARLAVECQAAGVARVRPRKVRKDGTVRWRGDYLEVRAELTGASVELRFDPEDDSALPRVFVDRTFACDTVPLDRLANMHRRRRRIAGDPDPRAATTGLDRLGLIEDEHYRRTRPVAAAPADDDATDGEADDALF